MTNEQKYIKALTLLIQLVDNDKHYKGFLVKSPTYKPGEFEYIVMSKKVWDLQPYRLDERKILSSKDIKKALKKVPSNYLLETMINDYLS